MRTDSLLKMPLNERNCPLIVINVCKLISYLVVRFEPLGALFMLINYTCYITHIESLNRCCLLGKYICPTTHFFMTFIIICYSYGNETELVVGWLEVELMRVLRFFVTSVE